ncbi:hypothetical protein LTR56_013754 [Elasticomyces elasticus]|nr:hypothetical protein LTR22_022823 [Elasticomyces elasticus]KAK3637219.1 hypothetical protein LTR56_013754 [Elasticomyces elasticus]KAK4907570.1 hypothetical protein LTR49_023437 [Elasticomyces elasticus]KAK5755287.1 hypothetical protein LTS12_014629 [Elasticomyces elasticus]
MKFTNASTLLALTAVAYALPAEFEVVEACSASSTAATSTAKTSSTSAPSYGGSTKYSSGATASDIDNNTGCTALTVIFARGTSESGNIGFVAGPPMFKQLISDLGASKLTLQGVVHPADAAGNANCGAAGDAAMAKEVSTMHCSSTKVVFSGYSQGACVVHNALQPQGVDASSIAAVVVFGDPFQSQSVGSIPSSNVLKLCAFENSICGTPSGGASEAGHTSYGCEASTAASFIEKITGVTK